MWDWPVFSPPFAEISRGEVIPVPGVLLSAVRPAGSLSTDSSQSVSLGRAEPETPPPQRCTRCEADTLKDLCLPRREGKTQSRDPEDPIARAAQSLRGPEWPEHAQPPSLPQAHACPAGLGEGRTLSFPVAQEPSPSLAPPGPQGGRPTEAAVFYSHP